ncbi:MAG TPA: RodZ domain-containing protein [Dongiaceae bacterium]|nr:RodZ domain-containing protein [Dongiaceae bacterium]
MGECFSPGQVLVGEFGDKFRKAREAKNLSLDNVSNVTKIGSRMLQAIEEEHFHQLPGGVFNKGFIRAYAKHLGINEDEAITSYLACLRQAQIDAQAGWDPQARPAAPDKRTNVVPQKQASPPKPVSPAEELPHLQLPRAEHFRPPRRDFSDRRGPQIPWGIVVAVAVVIVLGFLWWRNHSRSSQAAAPAATPPPAVSAPSPSATTQTVPSAVAPTPAQTRPGGTSSLGTPSTGGPSAGTPSTGTSPAGAATSAPPVAATTAPKPLIPAPTPSQPDAAVENKPSSALAAPANQPPAQLLTLIVRASETSWVSLTADGQPVAEETLIAPAHTSIRAHREIMVRVGNAAGVTFVWNGEQIPAQGAEAEVKTFVFDSTGMHTLPNQPPVPNQ